MISNVVGGDISLALWAGIVITPAVLWWLSRPRRCSDSSTDFGSFLKKRPDRAAPTSSALAPAREATSFNSFLKQAPPRHIPTKFSSFLKSVSHADNRVPAPDAAEEGDLASAPPDAARVAVLFGTEYGFSQDIAEKTCDKLKSTGKLWPVLFDMGDWQAGYEALQQEQAVLMVCSTQGDGVPPTEARGFCDWLAGLPEGSLASVNFSVCALGDRVERRADVDKEDWAAVNQWVHRAVEALLQLPLQSISEAPGAGATARVQVAASGPKGKVGGGGWGRQIPFMGEVLEVEPLCNVSSAADKNTVRLAVGLQGSGVAYTAGDALGIWPRNHPEHAEQLIRALQLDGEQQVRLPARAPRLREGAAAPEAVAPLREALECYYDIRSPKPDIFPLLQRLRNADEDPSTSQARAAAALALEEMIASPAKAAEYLEPRHVLDVFQDHPWAAPSAAQLVEALRPLQPRLYSLSSSPLEDGGQVAQATIAVVEYESLGRQRLGVCSTYIQQRTQVGAHIPVYIHPNPDFRLPEDATRPLIMIGPGTGVAPFRAFVIERLAQRRANPAAGRAVLYFGCRRSDQDFLYGEWLTQLAQQGDLTLHTAFSRMQDRKVYVQDRLRDTGSQVWQLLQEGAHVYVCGDASSMAAAVEEALLDIVAGNLPGGSRQMAEEYLTRLRSESRYQRDIW